MKTVEQRRTSLLAELSEKEGLDLAVISEGISKNSIVMLASNISLLKKENFIPCLIGKKTQKKIACAIGMTANDKAHFSANELNVILNSKPDYFMDLTVGSHTIDALKFLREILDYPLGCAPSYDILAPTNTTSLLSKETILARLKDIMETGVDFVCIPMGLNKEMLDSMDTADRLIPITSRTGGLLIEYMRKYQCENPFIEYLDDVLHMLKEYNVVLDLADIFRPGCTHDAFENKMKSAELTLQKKISDVCLERGVGFIIEGGGHLSYSNISKSLEEIHEIFGNVPVWCGSVLGTDRAVGKDSVANAIGVVKASLAGADAFLSVSNSEHYARPTYMQTADSIKDIHIALAIYRLEIGDPLEKKLNDDMSRARNALDWQGQINNSLFPNMTNNLFVEHGLSNSGKPCTMCGGYCPLLKNH